MLFGSLNLNGNAGNNLPIVINDLKGKIFLYDSNGVLLQELLIGESIKTTEGVKIKVVDFITSTETEL